MSTYTINLDYETSERAGAGGMFQVAGIWNEAGDEITEDCIDVGKYYTSLDQVARDMAKVLKVTPGEIDLEEV